MIIATEVASKLHLGQRGDIHARDVLRRSIGTNIAQDTRDHTRKNGPFPVAFATSLMHASEFRYTLVSIAAQPGWVLHHQRY